ATAHTGTRTGLRRRGRPTAAASPVRGSLGHRLAAPLVPAAHVPDLLRPIRVVPAAHLPDLLRTDPKLTAVRSAPASPTSPLHPVEPTGPPGVEHAPAPAVAGVPGAAIPAHRTRLLHGNHQVHQPEARMSEARSRLALLVEVRHGLAGEVGAA